MLMSSCLSPPPPDVKVSGQLLHHPRRVRAVPPEGAALVSGQQPLPGARQLHAARAGGGERLLELIIHVHSSDGLIACTNRGMQQIFFFFF